MCLSFVLVVMGCKFENPSVLKSLSFEKLWFCVYYYFK
jgi:hypothetical protein